MKYWKGGLNVSLRGGRSVEGNKWLTFALLPDIPGCLPKRWNCRVRSAQQSVESL